MALGAERGDVLRLVRAQGGKISAAGIVMGSAASLGLTRLMAKLLSSVSAADPATFAVVAFVLALIAIVASYIPARTSNSCGRSRRLRSARFWACRLS